MVVWSLSFKKIEKLVKLQDLYNGRRVKGVISPDDSTPFFLKAEPEVDAEEHKKLVTANEKK